VVAKSASTRITGVSLEVLPDDSLPQFGPGRQADANFVLSEMELKKPLTTKKKVGDGE
jgi:hypothetical protein